MQPLRIHCHRHLPKVSARHLTDDDVSKRLKLRLRLPGGGGEPVRVATACTRRLAGGTICEVGDTVMLRVHDHQRSHFFGCRRLQTPVTLNNMRSLGHALTVGARTQTTADEELSDGRLHE
jgi:hypothetical protein